MNRLDQGSHNSDRDAEVRVRIPADTDRPDRLLAGLTARQLALLALPAVALWVAWAALHRRVPLPVFCAIGAPLAVAAMGLALGRRDGLSADRLVALALRHALGPRRLVPAPDGVVGSPVALGEHAGPLPAPLQLPLERVRFDGTLDLAGEGSALVCRAIGVSFALRTAAERAAMVAAFARYLNGAGGPLEVVVRAKPVDLSPAIARLRDSAGGLPHPALEAAALDHAGFLEELALSRDLLSREVLVVFRDPTPTRTPARATPAEAKGATDGTTDGTTTRALGAPERLRRRAADAAQALQGAGIALHVLDASSVASVLAGALDPLAPRRSGSAGNPGEPVRGPAHAAMPPAPNAERDDA